MFSMVSLFFHFFSVITFVCFAYKKKRKNSFDTTARAVALVDVIVQFENRLNC